MTCYTEIQATTPCKVTSEKIPSTEATATTNSKVTKTMTCYTEMQVTTPSTVTTDKTSSTAMTATTSWQAIPEKTPFMVATATTK